MGTLKAIVDGLLKIIRNPRFMAVMCAICAALLFLPQRILAVLSVEPFVSRFRSYIGICFLFSLGMTVSYPIEYGWKSSSRRLMSMIYRRNIKERLGKLSSDEKELLALYISNNERTRYFFYHNGVAANLRLCRILYVPNPMADIARIPYTMYEWVWDYLHEQPELLK